MSTTYDADVLIPRIRSKFVVNDQTGCWEFKTVNRQTGYGKVAFGRKLGMVAHRAVYRALVGEIPPGLVLDHICRVKACVNPAHVEPVTQRENVRRGLSATFRGDSCSKGHLYSADNLRIYIRSNGTRRRECRACEHARSLRRSAERRASASAA